MSGGKGQVHRFYEVLWNARELEGMASILHEDFTFRGSLGERKKGRDGFAEYVERVHAALGDYRCVVEELVEEGDKVFAKMIFGGIHRGRLLGRDPTGKRLEWRGCALFTFRGRRISDLWVLGDLKALEDQLRRNSAQPPSATP